MAAIERQTLWHLSHSSIHRCISGLGLLMGPDCVSDISILTSNFLRFGFFVLRHVRHEIMQVMYLTKLFN